MKTRKGKGQDSKKIGRKSSEKVKKPSEQKDRYRIQMFPKKEEEEEQLDPIFRELSVEDLELLRSRFLG